MIDLDLLEKQLDEALTKETSETLSSWLNGRRVKSYISAILGDGEFYDISINKIEIIQLNEINVINERQSLLLDCVCPDFDYLLAA